MDGVLVVDKPRGLTSHDVVAAARRALGETRIGHTGTLDPLATGVLPLACGRATRLVRFLAASTKDYEAEIRIGVATDTYDVTGRTITTSGARPTEAEIGNALESLAGEQLQTPPLYSAKKIAGRRAYDLARSDLAVQPAAVAVRAERIKIVRLGDGVVTIELTCSPGFYVRSLAHDLGVRLGTGACLAALRRTRSGEFDVSIAVTLETLTNEAANARSMLVPLDRLLPQFPAAKLTNEGVRWVSTGRAIGPGQTSGPLPEGSEWVRLLSPDGSLAALAQPGNLPGSLHPSVVLI